MKLIACTIFATCLVGASGALGQDRCALLISNTDYGTHKLPANDGLAQLATTLESAGFLVTFKENLGKSFKDDLTSFYSSCPTGGVALVYFYGFGGQYERTVLSSVVASDGEEKEVEETVSEGALWLTESTSPLKIDDFARTVREQSGARVNLLFFDCATENPLAGEDQSGLLEFDMTSLQGGMVCYAMPPNRTLPTGTQSALAASLAKQVGAKDARLEQIMDRVKTNVLTQSQGKQQPWYQYCSPLDAKATVADTRERNISIAKLPPADPQAGDEWINSIGMVFCWCPPGTFRMGFENPNDPDILDAAAVEATVSKGFWISKYEMTARDYARAYRKTSKVTIGEWANVPKITSKASSAEDIASKDLTNKEKASGHLPPGWAYRFPTEAEWEYACRAGSDASYAFGESPAELHRYANYADASLLHEDDSFYYSDQNADDGVGVRPAPVGSYRPNAWGIHDMHGNVYEVVSGGYTETLPGGNDPKPKRINKTTVIRGGAWCSTAEKCRAGFRNIATGGSKSAHVGMRIVLAKTK